jgi:peptide/nickel transport system ATP-binding protein
MFSGLSLANTVTMPSDRAVLTVTGLTTVFRLADGRESPAIADVSFTLPRGRTLGLVGESGSGKSVTALSIVRLVMPPGRIVSGRVTLGDRDLLSLDEPEMRAIRGRRIGFVFQEPMVALDPVYTIGAQIVETLQVHGLARGAAARRRALDLLDAVHIPDPSRRAREYPHQLSGGLRQRAMLALALAGEPEMLIADEPTTALDVTVQAEILDLLRDLRRQFALSVLLITHDLGVVAEMADEIAVMYAGRIVEHGPVVRVFADPLHPYTRALFRSIPGAHSGNGLLAIPGTVPALGKWPAGCAFAPRCPDRFEACDQLPDLFPVRTDQEARCFLHAPTHARP